MKKKLLIIGDALAGLNTKGDTSLALAEGALLCGWQVHWTADTDIFWTPSMVCCESSEAILGFDGRAPQTKIDPTIYNLANFDLILIRKDPPVDEGYRNLCLMLAGLQNSHKTKVQNDPQALLHTHEKLLPFHMVQAGALETSDVVPSLFLSQTLSQEQLSLRLKHLPSNDSDSWIIKPWLGFAGRGVQKIQGRENIWQALNKQTILQNFESTNDAKANLNEPKSNVNWQESMWILQPYLPSIQTAGDRRVLVAQGQVICDIVRYAAPGSLAANLAQGGTAQLEPLSPQLLKKCEAIAKQLLKSGVNFAGIDIIGTKFTEVNITSPTGLRAFEDLAGRPLSQHTFSLIAQGI